MSTAHHKPIKSQEAEIIYSGIADGSITSEGIRDIYSHLSKYHEYGLERHDDLLYSGENIDWISLILKDIVQSDLWDFSYNWTYSKFEKVEWKDKESIHTWEEMRNNLDGYSQVCYYFGTQSYITYDSCFLRIFICNNDCGVCFLLSRITYDFQFFWIGEDDGCWFIDTRRSFKNWISSNFIEFKVRLMSEISELKIPINHQLIISKLFPIKNFDNIK